MKAIVLMSLLFLGSNLFCQENQIALTLNTRNGVEIKYVNSDTTELIFEKTYIKSIYGLDKLPFLETIIFDMTAFIEDFSFLEDTINLRKAVFVMVRPIDWRFIEKLPYIECLYIRACNIKSIELNLYNNSRLKYLEISNGSLDFYPCLINIPSSLEYLNLSYNRISSIPDDKKNKYNFLTTLASNQIEHFESNYITFKKPEDILPPEYIINNVSH